MDDTSQTFYKRVKKCTKNLKEYNNEIEQGHHYNQQKILKDLYNSKLVIFELTEAKSLIENYNTCYFGMLSQVNLISLPQELGFFSLDEIMVLITATVRELEDIESYLESFIEPELTNKQITLIQVLYDELEKLEKRNCPGIFIKNLRESLKEFDSGHYLPSVLLSTRMIIHFLESIKGKSDEERLDTLINNKIFPNQTKHKEEYKAFIDAVRTSRNVAHHDPNYFPDCPTALSITTAAFRMTNIFLDFSEKSYKDKKP